MAPEMFDREVMVANKLPECSHAPYMTIALPVCKGKDSNTTARSTMKRLMNTATEPTTVIVIEKDVLDLTDEVESSDPSPEVLAAQEALLHAIEPVRCVYTEKFPKLRKIHELEGSKDLDERVNMFLRDH